MTGRPSNNRKEYTLQELAEKIHGRVLGDGSITITNVAGLKEASTGSLTFLANQKYHSLLAETSASALIAARKEPLFKGSIVQVADPYLAFAQVMELFHPSPGHEPGIHPDAVIHPGAIIGEGVSIDACAVIQEGVTIGKGVTIMSGAVIGKGSFIGDDSCIHPQVTLYPDTHIGQKVIIHAGAVIGSDGFGYAQKEGRPCKVPQVGRVVIEDECEIGANVTIDRGTLGETRIGRGVKIDNLVQIGHNVTICPYSIIVAQVGISGSAQIGQGVILAGQVGVAGHIKIGDNVTVAAKAGVTKDVPKGVTIGGGMGMPIAEWRKSEAIYRNLPELQKKYRALQKRIESLEEKLK